MWVDDLHWGSYDPRLADRIGAHWPGWAVTLHNGGVPHHLALTGRDPAWLRSPVQDHLRAVGRIVTGADADPARLLEVFLAADPEGVRDVRLNPHFLARPAR